MCDHPDFLSLIVWSVFFDNSRGLLWVLGKHYSRSITIDDVVCVVDTLRVNETGFDPVNGAPPPPPLPPLCRAVAIRARKRERERERERAARCEGLCNSSPPTRGYVGGAGDRVCGAAGERARAQGQEGARSVEQGAPLPSDSLSSWNSSVEFWARGRATSVEAFWTISRARTTPRRGLVAF